MAEISRIEDLQRRLLSDSTSIAFAQLAEELRRSGQHERAVEVSRTGLAIYPEYVSARITLARALTALAQLEEAEHEFTDVLRTSPQSSAATEGLAAVRRRRADNTAAVRSSPRSHSLETQPIDIDCRSEQARSRRGVASVDEDDLLRAVRTLTALEAWLAAIHVARASRHA
jgi:hypothetical protein